MTHAFRRLSIGLICAALLAMLCVAGLDRSSAQTANTKPRIGFVNELTIKSGMMPEYLEWSLKEARPLYLKAGIKEAYFFTTLYGDRRLATLIEIHDSFAALKERNAAFEKNNSPEALAAWRQGAGRYIENVRTIISETRPELSWRNPKRQEMAPYYVLLRRWIAPFREPDYENYLKNEFLPLLKKADGPGIAVGRFRFGGESGVYNVLTPIYDLADFDGPNQVQKSIGQEAYRKLQQKALTGIVVRSETRVLQLRPELSIIPGQSAAAK
jgi:hypothetical protein